MPQLIVRGLDDKLVRALKQRAARHVKDIARTGVATVNPFTYQG
jgi:plasmid stability protein